MTYERRGDFQQMWRALHETYHAPSEVKWKKIKKGTLPFFEALIDKFFRRRWLMFHCFLMSKSEVNMALHQNDWDLARRKHFTLFLANKIRRFATPQKRYLIRVDPIHSRYQKADEAAETILSNILGRIPSLKSSGVIDSLQTVVAVARPQFEDLSRTDRTGKLVAEMAGGRADDGESVLAGVRLHALKLGWPRRDQTVEVVTDLGGQQIAHRRASGCGRRGDNAGRRAALRQASPRVLDIAIEHESAGGIALRSGEVVPAPVRIASPDEGCACSVCREASRHCSAVSVPGVGENVKP